MIERRTIVDQIEFTRRGDIQIRIGFVLQEDGADIDVRWHRTMIPAEMSIVEAQAQMAAVNAHLASMTPSRPPVGPAALNKLFQMIVSFRQINA